MAVICSQDCAKIKTVFFIKLNIFSTAGIYFPYETNSNIFPVKEKNISTLERLKLFREIFQDNCRYFIILNNKKLDQKLQSVRKMQWIKIRKLSILDIGDFLLYIRINLFILIFCRWEDRGSVCVNMFQIDLRPQTWPECQPSPATSTNQIFSSSCWQMANTKHANLEKDSSGVVCCL